MVALLAFGAGEASAATLLDRSGDDNGYAWPSQDFAAPDDAYDTEIASNFWVYPDKAWQLTSIRAIGSGGTATTARVTVYEASANSGPGQVLFSREAVATPPNYEVPLAGTPPLPYGLHWVSVQAVGGGQAEAWGWSQRASTLGGGARYRNPGNGYGTGCTSFREIGSCVGSDGGMQFVIFGERITDPPPPSNEFTVRRPLRDRKAGTAKLPVTVADPGVLTLRGSKVRPVSTEAGDGETVRLTVAARAKARKKLKRDGKLKVVPTVTFVPTGGPSASRSVEVRLKLDT